MCNYDAFFNQRFSKRLLNLISALNKLEMKYKCKTYT